MTLTLHHLQFSQSFRILWLLEALEADYELKIYERDPQSRLAPAEYKALSPLGTAPVVTDGDVVIAESNAAIDYILDRFPDSPLRPGPGSPERVPYLFWFHAAQGSWMPMLFMDMIFNLLATRAPMLARPVLKAAFEQARKLLVTPRLDAVIAAAEEQLGKTKWLAADHLTAADITMSYVMGATRQRGLLGDKQPNCLRWLEQMEADPAFQRAKAKDDGREMLFTG